MRPARDRQEWLSHRDALLPSQEQIDDKGIRFETIPQWLLKSDYYSTHVSVGAPSRRSLGVIEIDAIDEAPEELVEYFTKTLKPENAAKQAQRMWSEILERLQKGQALDNLYDWASRQSSAWGTIFSQILVRKGDEHVGWYDLDSGLDFDHGGIANLYDVCFVKQPLVTEEGRKLFLMTDSMWEGGNYPAEVGGRTTSKEASERKGYYDEPPKEDVFVTQVPLPRAAPPWLVVESTRGGSVLAPSGYVAVRIDMNMIEEILRSDGIEAFSAEPLEETVERVASWIVNTLEGSSTAGSVSTPQEVYAETLRYFRPRARFLRYKSHGGKTYGMWAGISLHSKEAIRDILLSIAVVYEGSTVWLYDLEAMKPDRVLTMWELIQDGPIVSGTLKTPGWYTTESSRSHGAKYFDPQDKKFFWPLSEAQWDAVMRDGEDPRAIWPEEDQGGPPRLAKYGMEVSR